MSGPVLRIVVLSVCLLGQQAVLPAQNNMREDSLHIVFRQSSLAQALRKVSISSGINIVFSPDMLPYRIIDREVQGSVDQILAALLHETGLSARKQDGQYIVFRPAEELVPYMISGYVEDEDTGERLPGAHLYDIISGAGSVTNEFGFFRMQSGGGQAMLRITYLGYQFDTVHVTRRQAVRLTIGLRRSNVIPEVVITDKKRDQVLFADPLSAHHATDGQLASLTYLGGELDVQRHFESKPGVSIGTDGIGGMHVRGGDGDQNLILFDGVPVYHSTHAIGILSVFNPLIVREVSLLKGDFPARYAGRLSSVLDVRSREGNHRAWSMQASAGLAAMNALVEGPLIPERVGVVFAVRRFLPGFYLRNLSSREKAEDGLTGETRYAFTDLNAKCHIILTPRDRIYLSLYHGSDRYNDVTDKLSIDPQSRLAESFERTLNWGNTIGVMRWNHQFGKHLFANTTLTLSGFELQSIDFSKVDQLVFDLFRLQGFTSREFKSRIRDAGARVDFDHFVTNTHRLRYGFTFTSHVLSPKSIVFDDAAQIADFYINEGLLDDGLFTPLRSRAGETGLYVEDILQISPSVELSSGVHFAVFGLEGTRYTSFQPRINLRMRLAEYLQAHVSGNLMTQYLHLLTSSGIGLPTDLWVPSTRSIRPQSSAQISAGMALRLAPRWHLHADVYYKQLRNLIAYREGASFLIREGAVPSGILDAANWETKVTQGSGDAYGAEFMLSSSGQGWTCEATYAYAHSTRVFPELNFGRRFPFRFDRRHAVALTSAINITKRLQVAVGWHYTTGIPITLAEARFLHPSSSPIFPPVEVLEFSERNAFRLPAYHRLDTGVRYVWRTAKAEHGIHCDVYNVYDRRNVLYQAIVQDGDVFRNRQFTVLPRVPSLSYRLKI